MPGGRETEGRQGGDGGVQADSKIPAMVPLIRVTGGRAGLGFLIKLVKIIANSHAVVRNNTERSEST